MSADDLAAKATEQLILHEKQKELQDMKLQAARHQQTASLQDRLKARLEKREERKASVKETKNEIVEEPVKVAPPTGHITFALVTIKQVTSILELTDEDSILKALEAIHDLLTKEFISLNIYKVKEDIGKFLLASQDIEDMLNLAMIIQVNFNDYQWDEVVMKLPTSKKLFRPKDSSKADAKPLFSGPRVTVGIHSGEAQSKTDMSGHTYYSGINIIKVESIGSFVQGGQIILSSTAWEKVDQSKIYIHHMTELGIYKLDGFSVGCKLIEILPASLKDRSKFFGSVCAHCNEVIQPKEKFFRALDCIWHMNHFRCFQCNNDLGGSYMEHEGSPYCKNCYLCKTAPKCKNCSNAVTAGYIKALGGYWHSDCFSCKRCMRKPSAEVAIYEYDGFPYCGDCYKQIATD